MSTNEIYINTSENNCCSCPNDCCSNNFENHFSGQYCTTTCSGSEQNWVATCLCLPLKIVLFFPCHMGVVCNCCLNMIFNFSETKPDKNYLC